MKMQTKLTIILLIAGLMSAGTVGAVSYWAVMRNYQQVVEDEAFHNFQQDMLAYLETYGGWEAATASEPFHAFVHRRRSPRGGQMPPGMPLRGGPLGRAPFAFLLLDPHGRVLKGVQDYPRGSQVPEGVLSQARPIEFQGKVAVLASPIGDPRLTPQDRAQLHAMRQSLLTGFGVALTLAVVLGLIAGRRLSRTLRALTEAIRVMHTDKEHRQQVPVTSSDELGELADAFNRMNDELSTAHRELRDLSIRDPLTQLFNRRHFDEHAQQVFEQAVRYEQPVTVMIGDLDHFKKINDDYSHAIGDEVLRRTARLLTEATRKSDVVARYGGEEFVIVFPNTDLCQARHCCEQLRASIESHPWHVLHDGLSVTMSIGLSAETAVGSAEKMLGRADENLYLAKSSGRNRIVPGIDGEPGLIPQSAS
jgi:two-component system cell cycle response regulator